MRERTGGLVAVFCLHLGIGLYPKLFVVGPLPGSAMLAAWLVAIAVVVLAVRRGDRHGHLQLCGDSPNQAPGPPQAS